jgi:putative endonuclease
MTVQEIFGGNLVSPSALRTGRKASPPEAAAIRRLHSVIPAKAGIYRTVTMKQFYIYMLASKRNGTLYTGVTSNLLKRVFEHKNDMIEGFTKKYHVHKLVYYEIIDDAFSAITREKQIKKWKREWKDLYDEVRCNI